MRRIKICCIQSVEEAETAIRMGASALGLVSAMPSGPGPIPEPRIAEIARVVPLGVSSVLLTCLTDPDRIVAQHHVCRTTAIQLCDAVSPEALVELRLRLPGVTLVQVIHVIGPHSVEEALAAAPHVNALLLDSGNPALAVKELGGTGRTHDWTLSREIRERCGVPVYLAGGLTPENVADAIRAVDPFGVDICSGVRINDRLDIDKLSRFFAAVYSAP